MRIDEKKGVSRRCTVQYMYIRTLLDRQYYKSLSLEEKREQYTCGSDFVTLKDIETWEEFKKKQGESNQY